MRHVEEDFIQQVSGRLERFGWERGGLARFSCPFCGDTKKRRGYLIFDHNKDRYRYHCHNCETLRGARLGSFLKRIDAGLADEYFLEVFKNTGEERTAKTIDEIEAEEKRERAAKSRTNVLFKPTQKALDPVFESMVRLVDLPEGHYAREYVDGRKLPQFAKEMLWFTHDWKKTCEAFDIEEKEMVERLQKEEARLVLPFYSTTGVIQVIQGRSFQNREGVLRYLTAKKTRDTEKTFGLDRLDFKKPKLVVEGPIDSLFLPNCVATADANLLKFADGDIYIPDCQYRNHEICRGIERIIESGKRVVLFPEDFYEKDINDMVKNRGLKAVLDTIKANVFKGLSAEMRFAELKKC